MALHAETDADDVDSPPAIRAHGLVKTFGALRAVDDVTFDLAPGRIYGLLGPNGSGKTTLIRLLTGLTLPTSGWAEVLGTRMPSRSNLGRIGYMTQTDGVYAALTVAENVRFFGAVYGVEGDEPVAHALEIVDLADRRSSIVGTLSGGQRRRLSLACALIHRPPVLFLDEPTVGVDPLLRVQFWAHFRGIDRRRHDDRGLEPRHGRGGPLRRAPVRPLRHRSPPAGRARRSGYGPAPPDLEQAFLRLGGNVEVTR